MGTYFADSDIDILVIGSASQQAFSEFAVSQLLSDSTFNTDGQNMVEDVRLVKSLVEVIQIKIWGVKFDLQYCRASKIVDGYILWSFVVIC